MSRPPTQYRLTISLQDNQAVLCRGEKNLERPSGYPSSHLSAAPTSCRYLSKPPAWLSRCSPDERATGSSTTPTPPYGTSSSPNYPNRQTLLYFKRHESKQDYGRRCGRQRSPYSTAPAHGRRCRLCPHTLRCGQAHTSLRARHRPLPCLFRPGRPLLLPRITHHHTTPFRVGCPWNCRYGGYPSPAPRVRALLCGLLSRIKKSQKFSSKNLRI